MSILKSEHKIENTAMKLKLGEHVIYRLRNAPDGVYFDVPMATHPVPDCYYAGMVTPVFDLAPLRYLHCPQRLSSARTRVRSLSAPCARLRV